MRNVALRALLLIALVAVVGCGGQKKPADLPELYPCKITVIQDGKPLEGASVILNDPSGSSRFVMASITDAKGVATLKTDGKYAGVPEGKYKVLISKAFIPESDPNDVPPEDPEARKEYDKRMAELNAQQADTVELQYKRPMTTPLEIEVTSAGAELTADVGEKVNILFSETMSQH